MLFAAVIVSYQKTTHAHTGLITHKFHGSFRKYFIHSYAYELKIFVFTAIPLLLPDSCVIPGFLRFKANWLVEISV